MFTEHLNETMRRFVNELKLNRQRKQAAAARGRAIDCMELEDRILLSASPIAPTWLVNKTVVGVQQTTTQTSKTVAADASGNHVAVWSSQNADGSWTVNAQRFNSAGTALGTQIQVSSKTSLDQQNATVSMNANGTFVITWTNDNGSDSLVDVYAKQFTVNPDGSVKSGAEFLVTSHTRDDQMNSSVAVNSSGGFVVTWSSQKEDGTGWAVYAERFDSSGNALGQAFKVECLRFQRPALLPRGDRRRWKFHRHLARPGRRRLGHFRATVRLVGQSAGDGVPRQHDHRRQPAERRHRHERHRKLRGELVHRRPGHLRPAVQRRRLDGRQRVPGEHDHRRRILRNDLHPYRRQAPIFGGIRTSSISPPRVSPATERSSQGSTR